MVKATARKAAEQRRAALEALWSWVPRLSRAHTAGSNGSPHRGSLRAGGRGRVGRVRSRRPRAERAAVFGAAAAVQVLTWLLTPSWPVRITAAVLTVLALPALTTLTFDRSNNR
jgi:hypothetical protein